jgi:hypothetical protein
MNTKIFAYIAGLNHRAGYATGYQRIHTTRVRRVTKVAEYPELLMDVRRLYYFNDFSDNLD